MRLQAPLRQAPMHQRRVQPVRLQEQQRVRPQEPLQAQELLLSYHKRPERRRQ